MTPRYRLFVMVSIENVLLEILKRGLFGPHYTNRLVLVLQAFENRKYFAKTFRARKNTNHH